MHHALPPFLLRWFLLGRLGLHRAAVPPARYALLRRMCSLRCTPEEQQALAPIAALRARLKQDPTVVHLTDFGAGTTPVRTRAEIYQRAASPHAWGVFLFRLVRDLGAVRVLELGTNLGISAAYLRLALDHNGGGRLVTLEGDPALAAHAEAALHALSANPTAVVQGRFVDTLPGVLAREEPFDLVFIDGHHEAEAAYRYVEMIRPHLRPDACMVLDDVEPWARTVRPAWHRLTAEHPRATAVDFWKMGLVWMPDD